MQNKELKQKEMHKMTQKNDYNTKFTNEFCSQILFFFLLISDRSTSWTQHF